MRLPELRSGTDPARADDEKNLRQNEIAQSERLFEGSALLFYVVFCAIESADHSANCRACAWLAHRKLADRAPALKRRLNRAFLASGLAARVRYEIRGGGSCRPRTRCSSPTPKWSLQGTPPRSRVARTTSASATERRSPLRSTPRARRRNKSVSERGARARQATHD